MALKNKSFYEKNLLFFYCLLALVLSSIVLYFQNFIGHDGVWYARIGENIFAGHGISINPGQPYVDHPPFYSFLIGFANLFLKDPEFSGHLMSIFAFSLTLIPLFYLVRSAYPGAAAHWVSLLYATHGFMLIHSNMVLAESLFILFLITQLHGVHRLTQDGDHPHPLRLGALVGMVSGLAFLTRPEGLMFYSAGMIAILILSSRPLKTRIFIALTSLAIFLIFFIPYIAFVHHHTHQWQLSGAVTEIFVKRQLDLTYAGGYVEAKKIYQGLTADKTRLMLGELKESFRMADFLTRDRFAMTWMGLHSMSYRLLEFNQYFYGGLGFFFMGAGVVGIPWNSQRKKSELLFLIYLLTIFPQFFGIFHPKRYLLYFPFFLIWMGVGVEALRLRLQKNSHAAALALCLLFALPSAWYIQHCIENSPVPQEYKELGTWMKQNIPEIEKEYVAARHPSIIYYSGAKLLEPPYLPYVDKMEDLITYMKHQNTRYFVVSDDLDSPSREAYRFLLDEAKDLPKGVKRTHSIQRRIKISLFEVSNVRS